MSFYRRWKLKVKDTYRFVRDDVFADGEAHAGTLAERGSDGAWNDAVSAHDPGCYVAQSSCHFSFFLLSPNFGDLYLMKLRILLWELVVVVVVGIWRMSIPSDRRCLEMMNQTVSFDMNFLPDYEFSLLIFFSLNVYIILQSFIYKFKLNISNLNHLLKPDN